MSAHYTLVIGTKNWSSWSLRAWLALRATGQPFDEDPVALRRDTTAEEVARRSPSGRVPVLTIEENGQTCAVWDSLAICETLAERHPGAGLWPDDRHARAAARAAAAEMHSGFADLREQLPMDFARRHRAPSLTPATEAQIARIGSLWSGALDRHGGDFLYGSFSIADCMYAPICSRFVTYGIAMTGAAEAYVARMMEWPAMRDWGEAAEREVAEGKA